MEIEEGKGEEIHKLPQELLRAHRKCYAQVCHTGSVSHRMFSFLCRLRNESKPSGALVWDAYGVGPEFF